MRRSPRKSQQFCRFTRVSRRKTGLCWLFEKNFRFWITIFSKNVTCFFICRSKSQHDLIASTKNTDSVMICWLFASETAKQPTSGRKPRRQIRRDTADTFLFYKLFYRLVNKVVIGKIRNRYVSSAGVISVIFYGGGKGVFVASPVAAGHSAHNVPHHR